jgi:hypothetical protein
MASNGEKSPLRSLTRFLANKKRKLVLTPVFDNYRKGICRQGKPNPKTVLQVAPRAARKKKQCYSSSSGTEITPNKP